MSSVVAISNLALSHLGDDANIASLTEGSTQATYCAQWYPIARDMLLEMHPWKFAVRRAALALVAVEYPSWSYVYREPAECLKLINLLPEGYGDDTLDSIDFQVESDDGGNLILTNDEAAYARYITRETNPQRFTPLFIDTLSWLLASYLAGPIIKGTAGQQTATTCYATFLSQLGRATLSNATQGKQKTDHNVPWITARA